MKKLLTTIILLCFSVAANADIYFCDPSVSASLTGIRARETTLHETTSIIIDTDKGIRVITPESNNQDYAENCVIEMSRITCSWRTSAGNINSFQMSLADESYEQYEFSYTVPVIGLSVPYLIAMVGTCTKA